MPIPRGGPILPVAQNGGHYHYARGKQGPKRRSLAWRTLAVCVTTLLLAYGGFFAVYMHRANVATLEVAPTRGELMNELVEEVNSVDSLAAAARTLARQQREGLGRQQEAAGARWQSADHHADIQALRQQAMGGKGSLLPRHQQQQQQQQAGEVAVAGVIDGSSAEHHDVQPLVQASPAGSTLQEQHQHAGVALKEQQGMLQGTQAVQAQYGRLEDGSGQHGTNPNVKEQAVKDASQAARASFGHIDSAQAHTSDSEVQQARRGAFVEEAHFQHVARAPGSGSEVIQSTEPQAHALAHGIPSPLQALTLEAEAQQGTLTHAPAMTLSVSVVTDASQLGRLEASPMPNPNVVSQVVAQAGLVHTGHIDTKAAQAAVEGASAGSTKEAHSTAGQQAATAHGVDSGGTIATASPQLQQATVQAPVMKVLQPPARGLYALAARDIHGEEQPLSQYAGNITLVVNVASACGYTDSNYKGLQGTFAKYHASGFTVLAFPCNQFGDQEPGSDSEIESFCSATYHTTFPLFSKVDVNGPNTHPVFKFLKQQLPVSEGGGGGSGPGQDIRWNFYKFLVGRDGQPIKRWDSVYDVVDVERAIYAALVAHPPTTTS